MNPTLIKIILIVGYALFVLIAKAVKAAKSSQGPGGVSIPQGTFIKPHPRPQPAAPPRPAQPRARPAARVAPVRPKAQPVRRAAVSPPAAPPRPVASRLQPVRETVSPVPAAPEAPRHALDAFLGTRMDLRQGIIMSELLGPPLALR